MTAVPHPTHDLSARHAPTLSVVGAVAIAMHFSVVVLLVPLGVAPLAANVAAFLAAFAVGLAGNYRWLVRARAPRPAVALRRFAVVAGVGFGLNEASYAALLTDTAIDYRIALLLVLAAVAALTSVAAREWAFAEALMLRLRQRGWPICETPRSVRQVADVAASDFVQQVTRRGRTARTHALSFAPLGSAPRAGLARHPPCRATTDLSSAGGLTRRVTQNGMTDELEDRRLVKRLLAHDREAFNAFFDGYLPRLYRFARTRLGDDRIRRRSRASDADESYPQPGSYRGEAALFTWLCTICRNEIADHHERVARERRTSC